MAGRPKGPKEQEGAISALDAAMEALNLAKEISTIAPAKAVFGSVSVVLVMIRDTMINQMDYVELGLACAEVCAVLDRGLNGKRLSDLNNSVLEAIKQLTTAMAEIRRKIIKQGKRNVISRHIHARNDKEKIVSWRTDLNRILHVFSTELGIDTHVIGSDTRVIVTGTQVTVSGPEHNVTNTHTMVSEIHRTAVKGQEGRGGKNPSAQTSTLGESPPLPPRSFFGRDELIEKVVNLTRNFTPTALIGAGGIGKTSIALTVLHHDRIKQQFGDDRRFIRCDQFPASRAHLLRRLSSVIGAGVENPEDLTPLRTFLSSRKVLIVLDNAESILDPQGTDAQETYAVVEELSRFDNTCICITSRISTTPPDFNHLDVPTLSMDAGLNTFYRIYDSNHRSNLVDSILGQLDFHPLSITLLATVAHQNRWDTTRLASEWEQRRTSVLKTQHSNSLAATIKLSLTSPVFQELGPDAEALLGVVAFFPQGVNEENFDWLFPAVSNATNIFNGLCILSLTYRGNGFITMLAPFRDHLRPKDPNSSSLLRATKDIYFTRMSVTIDTNDSSFIESQWITSEDINVEHLLDVFTTIDANSDGVWRACANFLMHLSWHKKRPTILKPKIEGLPDDHRSKPDCLFQLSCLFESVGDQVERKRVLTHALKLQREWGSDHQVARTLRYLSDTNRLLDLPEEGIRQAKEALEILERLGDTVEQAHSLVKLAFLLQSAKQLEAAEEAAFRAIGLTPENQSLVSRSHRVLGDIYQSKGENKKAIHHYKLALEIASSLDWHDHLFSVHYSLAGLFYDEGRLDDAHNHLEQAKLHAANSAHSLGYATELHALVWYEQDRLEEARSEALRAIDIYERLGAAKDVEDCSELLRDIRKGLDSPVASEKSELNS